jgi:hypothetical protein
LRLDVRIFSKFSKKIYIFKIFQNLPTVYSEKPYKIPQEMKKCYFPYRILSENPGSDEGEFFQNLPPVHIFRTEEHFGIC